MSTGIQWTSETWNPLAAFDRETGERGWFCTKVSPGCTNCYAEALNKRFGTGHGYRVPNLEEIEFRLVNLGRPLEWEASQAHDRVFVNSMTDLFHEEVGEGMLDRIFAVMAAAEGITFQVLTKRPGRMADYMSDPETPHRVARAIDEITVEREIEELEEEWAGVPGFPNYRVSNHGRVEGPRGHLSPDVGAQGHGRVTLYRSGERQRFLVHRLVLRAFRREPREGEQARHLNGDATCNALPNLRWGTQQDNWNDAKRHGSHRRHNKLSPEDVDQIRDRGEEGEPASSIAGDFPVSDTQIRNILAGDQWSTEARIDWPPPGVWLGTSVEDQERADERVPQLQRCPAAVRFLSCEPLLGSIDLRYRGAGALHVTPTGQRVKPVGDRPEIDWVIVGGESGPGARPMSLDWPSRIVEQCRQADVPVFVKQLGSRPVRNSYRSDGAPRGDLAPYKCEHSKGGDPSEWPEDLRVREFPERAEVPA